MLNIRRNTPLAPLTTFGIGGNAKFFAEVNSVDELRQAVDFSKNKKLPIFILGGGSNIVVSDDGFEGLVIKMSIKRLYHKNCNCNFCGTSGESSLRHALFIVGAGEMWDDVVAKAVELGAGGIENLSLIPGTVGGAVYQNIGAYGAELKDVLNSVKAYDTKTGEIIELSNKECGFEYRSSVFKKNKDLIILEAELLLSKVPKLNLSYPDLQKRFAQYINPDMPTAKLEANRGCITGFAGQIPSISEIRNAVIEIRKSKLVYPDEAGSAGSFFKNPVIPNTKYHILYTTYPDLKGRDLGNGLVKLSAAQLIEKCGFKGKRIGNVGVSDKHALVLVNYGAGTAQELATLEAEIRSSVETKFGVILEPEVEKVAF